MTPEEMMSMSDDQLEALEASDLAENKEESETVVNESVENSLENSEANLETETKETETDSSENENDEEEISPMSLDDDEFEKWFDKEESTDVADNVASEEEGTYNKDDQKEAPTVDDLKAQSQIAKHSEEEVSEYLKNKDIVDALKNNGLLDNSKVNAIIGVTKGNKKAFLELLESAGLKPSDLVDTVKSTEVGNTEEKEKDEFDSWFDGDDEGTEKKPEESSENKEEKSKEVTEEQVIDYIDQEAVKRVATIALEIEAQESPEFLAEIDVLIDAGSFEMLKKNPEDIRHLAEQKKSGVMQLVNERMETLNKGGFFPEGLPYLSKYQLTANMLIHEQSVKQQQPVDTRKGSIKKSVPESIKHADSTSVRTTSTSAPAKLTAFDILNMSDEQFEKL